MTSELTDTIRLIESGKRTLTTERDALDRLQLSIDDHFAEACLMLMQTTGRVVVLGVGKSGHIAKKIAATLASTGSPAFFVHPAEAGHGDLGMITSQDTVLMVSNSGGSSELLALIPALKRLPVRVIAMVGNTRSAIADGADIVLNIAVEKEACPHNLAPTASTTAALAMGDALAVALLEARQFSPEDFARAHPSGTLGRRLLLRVSDVMRKNSDVPAVSPTTTLAETLTLMSQKGLGMTTVVDEHNTLLGIFTDGDLRRSIDANKTINHATIGELAINTIMTLNPQTVLADTLAIEALEYMENKKITALVVADNMLKVQGVLHLHDLLRAGLV